MKPARILTLALAAITLGAVPAVAQQMIINPNIRGIDYLGYSYADAEPGRMVGALSVEAPPTTSAPRFSILRPPAGLSGEIEIVTDIGERTIEMSYNMLRISGRNQLVLANNFSDARARRLTGYPYLATTVRAHFSDGTTLDEVIVVKLLSDLNIAPVTGADPADFSLAFDKKIEVFGITLYATPSVTEGQLTRSANIVSQLVDNSADTRPDNPRIVNFMSQNNAVLLMMYDEIEQMVIEEAGVNISALESGVVAEVIYSVDLGSGSQMNDGRGTIDSTIPAALRLMGKAGYARANPNIFGDGSVPLTRFSIIMNLMNRARGGVFDFAPPAYPPFAHYTDYDWTKSYTDFVRDYFYWGVSTNMNAQNFSGRANQVAHIWRPLTPHSLKRTDPWFYYVINRGGFAIPRNLPDGNYNPKAPVPGQREQLSWKDIIFGIPVRPGPIIQEPPPAAPAPPPAPAPQPPPQPPPQPDPEP